MQIADVVYLQWVLVYNIKKAPRVNNLSRRKTAIYQSVEFDTQQDKHLCEVLHFLYKTDLCD